MAPGESHNEWYHYYCSIFYVFKKGFRPGCHMFDIGLYANMEHINNVFLLNR